jgi:hypothetical protein
MDPAIKQAIDDLGRTFEAFKAENDARIKELQTKGFVSGETLQKIERMNAALDNITAMKAQLEALDTAVGRIAIIPAQPNRLSMLSEHSIVTPLKNGFVRAVNLLWLKLSVFKFRQVFPRCPIPMVVI